MKKTVLKRFNCALLITLLLIMVPGTTVSAGTRFIDVLPISPYYDGVIWATERAHIANGYPGTEIFGTDLGCTRGHAMMFLWKLAGKPTPDTSKKMPFSDVPTNHAFYKAVLWGSQCKITKGFPDGTFGIDTECTRGQIMTFIWRYKGMPAPSSKPYPFKDTPTAAFRQAIKWGAEKKITKGFNDGKFHDTFTCTRGQIVTFLYRMTSQLGSAPKVSVPGNKALIPTPTPTKKPTPTPAHTHTWEPVYGTVDHEGTPEQGHTERQQTGTRTVVDREAFGRPIYEWHMVCSCGAYITNEDEADEHMCMGHRYGDKRVQVGVEHIDAETHEEPVYEDVYVVDKPTELGYDESVITGYRCSGCSATK